MPQPRRDTGNVLGVPVGLEQREVRRVFKCSKTMERKENMASEQAERMFTSALNTRVEEFKKWGATPADPEAVLNRPHPLDVLDRPHLLYNPVTFQVNGDHMDDGTRESFQNGDILFCRELPREEWADTIRKKKNSFWVIIRPEKLIHFRQIESVSEDGATIVCRCLNKRLKEHPERLALDSVSRLFKLVLMLPHDREF